MVRSSCFGPKVDAVHYYGKRLAEINQKLRPKQEAKLEAAKVGWSRHEEYGRPGYLGRAAT